MAFCPKCGNQVTSAFCASCGTPVSASAPVQIVPPAKKSRKKLLIVFGLIVVLLIIIGSAISNSGRMHSEPTGGVDCRRNSIGYLEMLKRGDADAARLWKSGVRSAVLFNVRDYNWTAEGNYLQSGGQPYPVPRVYYRFDVQSSTKIGIPIQKRWDVVLEPSTHNVNGDACAIVALNEAP